ncbi:glycosyltransferase family 39 protein [bacterium]|nr:glycosyltransferase family 39 protein [bacterium]
MKEALKRFQNKLGDINTSLKEKSLGLINKHPEIFCLSLLGILCVLFLIIGLDFYPFLDVDETRYALMAKQMVQTDNWNNLLLNYAPFLEKPPLYFWLVATSIKCFGRFSEFAVRLPIALLAGYLTFFTYFLGKKILSRKFGMLSALILLSSVFYLVLAHIAIIDMVLTVFVTSAIYCGFLSNYVQDKFKKYCWWYFYAFIGCGFLAKGLLAIILPIIVIFFYQLLSGKLKEMFKPLYIIPGAVLFLLISIPWHFIMYKEYGNQFFIQYFLIHHFARFVNSEFIGRERPVWYFIPVFIVGFLPWTFVFLAFLSDGCKKLAKRYKEAEGSFVQKIFKICEAKNNEEQVLLFASVYFLIVFIFFSFSSTKLPTYILPAFPAASLLTGYFWLTGAERDEHKKSIYGATVLFSLIFIVAALCASCAYWFLPPDLKIELEPMKTMTICGVYLVGIFLLLRLNTKKAISVFGAYILTMLFVITIANSFIFNVIYDGGENEIVDFSRLARFDNAALVSFDFSVKPSAMLAYGDYVSYIDQPNFEDLDIHLSYKASPVYVIVKNKNLRDAKYKQKIDKRLEILEKGEKYSLYVKKGDIKKFKLESSFISKRLGEGFEEPQEEDANMLPIPPVEQDRNPINPESPNGPMGIPNHQMR